MVLHEFLEDTIHNNFLLVRANVSNVFYFHQSSLERKSSAVDQHGNMFPRLFVCWALSDIVPVTSVMVQLHNCGKDLTLY